MESFHQHSGKIALLLEDNIDTDRIIPARFLSRVSRSGYGELLFSDVRKDDFPLDRPEAKGASILVVGTNFGCGSSREHAVWAIQQAGYRAVIALIKGYSPGYSDIFRQNAANCGLLLIELPEADHAKLVKAGVGATITIDLPNQTIAVGPESIHFEMNPTNKEAIVNGLDLIGTTLVYDDAISNYEGHAKAFVTPGA
ncbi:MAG: 3-isopropylmalate dehydratase small subunit [Armatimonadetes bacterium]|nr:3-isopropylmalate dehydratase small subunit [Armatimonadota bacterium]